MMNKRIAFAPIIILMFWAGFVCAISFMEAWLKFQAPGVTLPIGLGIGKLVFTGLNRVEIVLTLLLLYFVKRNFGFLKDKLTFMVAGLAVIVAIQTFVLLPVLTHRAVEIINGAQPTSDPAHFVYIGLEVIKVILLFSATFGVIRKLKAEIHDS
ncbi:hypothetical protein [Prolixibacter denitrificans]|uniref:DUF4149 domain-containing protein n=1 Tax=Prolixibacter denitrificans TaxID=1541063 RepID=A0A2P8C6A6_9BACT|nr:hypothetical protein [Prolixibacter denitrificans]PSK80485.1 hypothetical protein CLV93_11515 [Prolixibacter denitrificans]GET22737.1 hypothetical protein JCM18694_29830 [Prolixibacter denitrificans]